ncbi:MAG: hypothetical protein RIF32_04135 [Leptospirales bacterium]|jgi:hypothetical protein
MPHYQTHGPGIDGPRSPEEIAEINKAIEANEGKTDLRDLGNDGPGEALGLQSMDKVKVSMTFENEDFQFIREIPEVPVDATLVEYNRQLSHGPGAPYRKPFIGQTDDPIYADPEYKREYEVMAYMADAFSYSRPATMVRQTESTEVVASNSSMMRILEAHATGFWFNDRSVMPYEDFGLLPRIPERYDCRGSWPEAAVLQHYTTKIRSKWFGLVNKLVMPFGSKNLADNRFTGSGSQYVLQNLPSGTGGVVESNVVKGLNCSQAKGGLIEYATDRWIDETQIDVPMVQGIEAAVGDNPPGAPALVANPQPPSVPGSLWDDAWTAEGDARYRVVALGVGCASIAAAEVVAPIATDGAVNLEITPSTTGHHTEAFLIFRWNHAKGRHYKVAQIKRTPGTGPTIWTDLNQTLPGYGTAVLGDFNSQGGPGSPKRTLYFGVLLQATKFNFYPGSVRQRTYNGMIEYYRALIATAIEKFVRFDNMPVQE